MSIAAMNLRRIRQEMNSIQKNPNKMQFIFLPNKKDFFEWHFVFNGPEGSVQEQGLQCGKITLPADQPCRPPDIYFFNENGRFETDTKICLNITAYHKETWSPDRTLMQMIEAIIYHFPHEETSNPIGAVNVDERNRFTLAISSRDWAYTNSEEDQEFQGWKLIDIYAKHLRDNLKMTQEQMDQTLVMRKDIDQDIAYGLMHNRHTEAGNDNNNNTDTNAIANSKSEDEAIEGEPKIETKLIKKTIKKQIWVKRQGVQLTLTDAIIFVVIIGIFLFLWNSQSRIPSQENFYDQTIDDQIKSI